MPNTSRVKIPYPRENQDPWYEVFVDFAEAVDRGIFSTWEDRNFILMGGGVFIFDAGTGLLVWDDDIEILSAVTGFLLKITAGSINLADGEMLYVELIRAPQNPPALTVKKATQLPNVGIGHDFFVLAVRRGAQLYWRNGALLFDGESLAILETRVGGGGGGGSGGGAPTKDDKDQSPANTAGDFFATGLTLTNTPVGDRNVNVFVNGDLVDVGDGVKTKDAYFSNDGGTTARAFAAILSGDELIWNGTIANFNLTASDDVDFDYDVGVGGGGGNDHGALTGLADDDHPQYQLRSEEGAANGYAGLNGSGVIPLTQLPAHASTHEFGGTDVIEAQSLGSGAAGSGQVMQTDGLGGWVLSAAPGFVPLPTEVGQVLFSVDGLLFTNELPVTTQQGWLVNAEGILIVQG